MVVGFLCVFGRPRRMFFIGVTVPRLGRGVMGMLIVVLGRRAMLAEKLDETEDAEHAGQCNGACRQIRPAAARLIAAQQPKDALA